MSPATYDVPSGFSQVFWFAGQAVMNLRLRSMVATVRGRSAKPSRAYSMARRDTSSNDSVPHRSSTVSAAWIAPGTTAGSSPSPSSVLFRVRYQSIVAAFGAQPCPTIEMTFFSFCG